MRALSGLLPAYALAVCLVSACAQTTSAAAQAGSAPADQFAEEPFVILHRETVNVMHADGTGYRESTLAIRLQSDAALRQFGVIGLPYASGSSTVELRYARVRRPDGTVIETPVAEALDQPAQVTREAPFYSDLKEKQLPVRSLHIGDTLEWQARITVTKPEIPGQFWGQDTFVTEGIALGETEELHVPAGTHVIVWTNPKDIPPPVESTSNGERVYRWTHKNLKPTVGKEAEAAKTEAEKHLLSAEEELDATEGALPSFAWTTFPDWAAVGAWYRGLEIERTVPNAAVKAKVAELTAGKSTDEDKARAVYDYVSTQIRYIGVAFGIGRYQPHPADEVLANQYGDCKDKHTLLAAMLTAIGLQPDAVLIGSGLRFNAAVPSPGSFNHLITHVRLGGKDVWLDSTPEVAPWGDLMPGIRDHEALLIPSAQPPTVVRTPVSLPYPASFQLTATESLDKDLTSDARITMTFRDDDEAPIREMLRQLPAGRYGEFVQGFLRSLGFGGTTSNPDISRVDDLAQPLTISFDYHRVKEAEWGENRVTEPFMPILLPGVDEKKPPTQSILLGVPRTETSKVEIKLPPGWHVELPEAVHATATFATADTTFRLADGKIYGERKLTVLASKVPAADWKKYKDWSDEAGLNSYPYIQLLPATGASVTVPSASNDSAVPPPPTGASAAQLIQQALRSIQSLDTVKGKQLLDQAKSLNPKQRGLWAGYGSLYYMLGEPTESIANLKKELELHPEELNLYGMIAGQQGAQHDNAGATATLRAWVAAAPDDPNAVLYLMRVLVFTKQNGEAVATGAAALAKLSAGSADLTQLRLLLASAQASTGKKSDAAATVRPLLGKLTEPSDLNSVAYFLADANVDLAESEAAARQALEKLEAETHSWTMDEAPLTLAQRTSLLVATWDTLGWIEFRQGKLAEARNFVSAAWHNSPNSEVTSHMLAIGQALHDASITAETRKSEQDLRTIPLGPCKGQHGTAELRMLLAGGKVVRADSVSGSKAADSSAPGLSDAADRVKQADLHELFPGSTEGQLVRQGFVNCTGDTCQLVFLPMRH